MQGKTFTARESEVLKTIDTIIKVCNEHSTLLPFVPKFEEKFQALKTKRSEVAAFSIDKHQAKSNQSAIVSDVDTEKGTLATYVSEKIGAFMEFAKETNDAKLSNMIPNMLLTKLKSQKPLDMVTNVLSFVETANKLDFTVAEQYGIKKSWLQNVADKTHTYNNLLPQQNATKQNKPKATGNLKTKIKELGLIKTSMDNLIGVFKEEHADFFNSYTTSKSIYRPPSKNNNKEQTLLEKQRTTPKKRGSATKKVNDTAANPGDTPDTTNPTL